MTLRNAATCLVLFSTFAAAALAQAPHALTPAERDKVAALVHKMTLDQKLVYIGGTGFAIRAVPELGLPAFEMSDGPFGTRSNADYLRGRDRPRRLLGPRTRRARRSGHRSRCPRPRRPLHAWPRRQHLSLAS